VIFNQYLDTNRCCSLALCRMQHSFSLQSPYGDKVTQVFHINT